MQNYNKSVNNSFHNSVNEIFARQITNHIRSTSTTSFAIWFSSSYYNIIINMQLTTYVNLYVVFLTRHAKWIYNMKKKKSNKQGCLICCYAFNDLNQTMERYLLQTCFWLIMTCFIKCYTALFIFLWMIFFCNVYSFL